MVSYVLVLNGIPIIYAIVVFLILFHLYTCFSLRSVNGTEVFTSVLNSLGIIKTVIRILTGS